MADLEQKNKKLNPAVTATAEKSAAPENRTQYDDPHLQELHDNRFEKKGARRAFHAVNFLGLHQIFNNVTSVIIAYYMTTTKLADTMKDKMASTDIGKGLSEVLTFPNKIVNGVFKIFGVDFDKAFHALPPEEKKIERAFRAAKSQRSAIEVAFMCAAGFIALMPVYFLEKNRAGFLNKVDNWLHPGRSKEEKQAAALTKDDEPKETLWNLFRARIIALAVVFGFDQARDNIDNILKHKHRALNKPGMYKNADTIFGWGLGDKIYNKLPENTRTWLAKFFSGNFKGENIALRKIQHETRGDILEMINAPDYVKEASKEMAALGDEIRKNHGNEVLEAANKAKMEAIDHAVRAKGGFKTVERAVFAEQSRLFITKEVLLTTILSAVIYTCAKWGPALQFMETIGLAKKGTYEKEHAHLEARKNGTHAPQREKAPEELEEKGKYTSTIAQRKPVQRSGSNFTESAVNSQNQEATVSL